MMNALKVASWHARSWTSVRVADARTLVALEHRGLVAITGSARDGWYKLTPAGLLVLGQVSP
jgi:hypothetical protein